MTHSLLFLWISILHHAAAQCTEGDLSHCCCPTCTYTPNDYMRGVCEDQGCQYINNYCSISSPAYYECEQTCENPVCVSGLSQELDGEYVFDGFVNRNGKAPSWKKEGVTSTDYYLYWYVEYFRITADANKKAGSSTHIALCLAPSATGYYDPDYPFNGGDCTDKQWHYQYINSTTNTWQDIYVKASVSLGSCTKTTQSPTEYPTTLPTTYVPSKLPTFIPTTHPTTYPTFYPTNVPTDIPSFKPSLSPTSAPTLHPSQFPTANPQMIATKTTSKSEGSVETISTRNENEINVDEVMNNSIGSNDTVIIFMGVAIFILIIIIICLIFFYKLRTKQLEQTQNIMANIIKTNTERGTPQGTNAMDTPMSPHILMPPSDTPSKRKMFIMQTPQTQQKEQGSLSDMNNALPDSPNTTFNQSGRGSFCVVNDQNDNKETAKLDESQEDMYSGPGAMRQRGQTMGSTSHSKGNDGIHVEPVLETPNSPEVEGDETN